MKTRGIGGSARSIVKNFYGCFTTRTLASVDLDHTKMTSSASRPVSFSWRNEQSFSISNGTKRGRNVLATLHSSTTNTNTATSKGRERVKQVTQSQKSTPFRALVKLVLCESTSMPRDSRLRTNVSSSFSESLAESVETQLLAAKAPEFANGLLTQAGAEGACEGCRGCGWVSAFIAVAGFVCAKSKVRNTSGARRGDSW